MKTKILVAVSVWVVVNVYRDCFDTDFSLFPNKLGVLQIKQVFK